MLESLVRPKEGSVFVVGGVPIARNPRPMLPEPGIGLLIPKQIVMIRLGVRAMHGEFIGGLKPQMCPAETGTGRVGV